MFISLLAATIALADQPKVTRAHFYCLSAVAKLGGDRLRAVPTKDGRSLMLAKAERAGNAGYYLLDMPSGAEASVAFLDARLLGALNKADVKEAFPPELLATLKKDAGAAKPAADAAKFAHTASGQERGCLRSLKPDRTRGDPGEKSGSAERVPLLRRTYGPVDRRGFPHFVPARSGG